MASGVKIFSHDYGYKELVRRVYGIQKPKISVGILEKDGAQEHKGEHDLTVLEVAIWNEFGVDAEGVDKNGKPYHVKIPPRSFIRAWVDENQERIREAMHRLMESVVAGKRTKEEALELLGQWCVGQIQARIAQGIPPPNAPSTIAAKGSATTPLINTGQLRSSVSYRVEDE